MTQSPKERRLEAPPRRLEATPPRIVEKAAVIGYRSMAAALAHLPTALTVPAIGGLNQLAYLLWPTKRRYSNANFAHVLGLPPDHRRVHRMVLHAYRQYAQYMVEVMRLPTRPAEEVAKLVLGDGVDRIATAWQRHGNAMIVCAGHVGNNEAVAAGIASRGYPANVIADDSAYPEVFEILRRNREGWGVHVVPWRNLREIFAVLRRREILALLVDWGYHDDGIPVRLFGAWTTLPAGPAVLAAKTGAALTFIEVRRTRDGRFQTAAEPPFTVASSNPADLQRATQRIADALERTIARAPAQWYSFKPMWPATEEEGAELERRANEMLAGRDGGPASSAAKAAGRDSTAASAQAAENSSEDASASPEAATVATP